MLKKIVGLTAALILVSASGLAGAADFKPVNLRYATQHPVDHTAQAAAEAIKAGVEEKTEGRVKISI